jgi:hypothetical protein
MAILGNTTINGSLNINGVPVIPGENSGETGVWKGSVSVATGTPAKTVTLSDDSYTPQAGDVFFIKFINGNSASNPTLNINGKGAKPIYVGSTGTTTLGVLPHGVTLMLHYDGSHYRTSLDAATVNGFTVDKSVPADAVFTDTVYTLTKEKVENVLTGVISSHSHPNPGVVELKAISAGVPDGQFVSGDLYYDTLDKKIYKYSIGKR